MRKLRVKQIREKVFADLQYEPTVDDPKKKILKDPDFRSVCRAARKNYLKKKRIQYPFFKTSRRQQRQKTIFGTTNFI